jgi:hypothetical protein
VRLTLTLCVFAEVGELALCFQTTKHQYVPKADKPPAEALRTLAGPTVEAPPDRVLVPLSRGNQPIGPSGLQAGTNSSDYRWLASKVSQAKTMNCLRCVGNLTDVQ